MSSMPFFNLARKLDISYGLVLSYTDAIKKCRSRPMGDLSMWEWTAYVRLSRTPAGDQILETMLIEQGRRYMARTGEDCRHD